MTDLTTYPRQDLFETELLQDVDASATSIVLNDAPSFALSSGSCYIHVDYDSDTKYEPMLVTAKSGSTLTVTRGVPRYEGGGSTATTHTAGAKIRISVGWKDFDNIRSSLASKLDETDGRATTPLGDAIYASLAALQSAYPSPANGLSAYCTAEGQNYDSAGGAWVARATGTNPNASPTVAGKVEIGTEAELLAGTQTGGTGAYLSPDLSILIKYLIPVGTILDTFAATAPAYFHLLAGGTIGDASSGASVRANADQENLFTFLWNNLADTQAPVSTGRGANAAADFAAHKTITLPDMRGKTSFMKNGATFSTMGATGGGETQTLVAHTHDLDANGGADAYLSPSGTAVGYFGSTGPSIGSVTVSTGAAIFNSTTSQSVNSARLRGRTSSITSGASAQNVLNPYMVINKMIKY